MEMNQNKQEAKAGDNSRQVQIENLTVYQGVSASEVVQISKQTFEIMARELTEKAIETAWKRVDNLTQTIISRVENIEEFLKAFEDPSFQKTYIRAQQAAAATDEKGDYKILAELLASRITTGEDRYHKLGINQAIQVVDEVADNALLGLTVAMILLNFSPKELFQGFDKLENIFQSFPLQRLPETSRWIEHLSMLGLVETSFSSYGVQDSYEEIFFYDCPMYGNYGIKKDSLQYADIQQRLQNINLAQFINQLLVNHELHPGYLRLNVRNEEDLAEFIEKFPKMLESDNMGEELHKIYDAYFRNYEYKIDGIIVDNLEQEIAKRHSLSLAVDWWNRREHDFHLLEPGIVLACANVKCLHPQFDMQDLL